MPSPRTTIALGLTLFVARRALLDGGATAHERWALLPGDDVLPEPSLAATRAISIAAPTADVWPWLAQLGQGRGGFYSYDWLENLIGCDIRNADRVVPEWQDVAVGDEVRLHPDVALTVIAVEPGRALVLRGAVPPGEAPYDFTWAFVLVPDADATRLVVRERYRYLRWWAPLLVEPVGAVSSVMSRRMLRGIRDRAQRAALRPRAA